MRSNRTRTCSLTLEPEMSDCELVSMERWLKRASFMGRHLEIGTAAGGTLCFLMRCYEDKNRPHFTVVDTMEYFPEQFELVKKNLKKNGLDPGCVEFRVQDSSSAFECAKQAGEEYDFILIDASHKIRYVMRDLYWLSLLKIGGIACFHDYEERFKGVRWPVDRFLRRNPQFDKLGLTGSLLCLRREGHSLQPEITLADRIWALMLSPLLQLDLSIQKRFKPYF